MGMTFPGEAGAPLIVSYGAGVDSTAMLVAMKRAGIVPGLVLFADTGAEKPETYQYLRQVMNPWLRAWAGIEVTEVRYRPKASTGYSTLTGNCVANETLPSLAFGMHSCSVKWKITPQEAYIQGYGGVENAQPGWQPALDAWATGVQPVKAIGYDAGPADLKRAGKVHGKVHDPRWRPYTFWYPLQDLGWKREDCVQAIAEEGLPVPVKSACFFCPASKQWELWWLAGAHPDLFVQACQLEFGALTGKHSRWDRVEWGAWESHLATGKEFPSKQHCGLGRSMSWCKFAWDNGLLDLDTWTFTGDQGACLERAAALRTGDNALDVRSCGAPMHAAPDVVEADEPGVFLIPALQL